MQKTVSECAIEVVRGDITKEQVDAIVNAANSSLLGGGGVDGAIHRAGGPEILEQCRKLDGCETGDAKITTGGRLPARYVIHTVGPVFRGGSLGEPQLLASCYRRSLELARDQGLKTVSFPAISCGVYGYPVKEAAVVAIGAVIEFIMANPGFDRIRFVMFSPESFAAFANTLDALDA